MSAPRFVAAGTTVLITRRALRRHFLFRPDPDINRLFIYALSVCSQQFDVEVHCAVLMSTHEHILATDTLGRLPEFTAMLHRIMALGTKVLRKWEGSVWDNDRPSVVHARTPEAVIREYGYVMANPVTAGAVEYAKQWPGVWLGAADQSRCVVRVQRPEVYFDADRGDWPEHAELVLTLPAALRRQHTDPDLRTLLTTEQLRQEQAARDEAKRKGWKFLGALKVQLCSPFRRSTNYEPLRSRNPTFAAGPSNREQFFAAVQWLRDFRSAYRAALTDWCLGLRYALFPFGTWHMRRFHAAPVAPQPSG